MQAGKKLFKKLRRMVIHQDDVADSTTTCVIESAHRLQTGFSDWAGSLAIK